MTRETSVHFLGTSICVVWELATCLSGPPVYTSRLRFVKQQCRKDVRVRVSKRTLAKGVFR